LLNSNVEFNNLGNKCLELLEIYEKKDYQENFSFIDNIIPVKSKIILDKLNQNLIGDLNKKNLENINIAYPDQIEYDRCEYFKITGIGEEEECCEIDKTILENIIKIGSTFNFEKIKNKIKITGFEASDNKPVIGSESLFGFLVYQTKLNDDIYILSNKKWFKIDADYLSSLDTDIKMYTKISSLRMPVWKKIDKGNKNLFDKNYKYHEGEYNKLVASQNSNFIYFDKENFQIPKSKSKIEVCDLYEIKSKSLICVKKLRGSSTLSHLFAQGNISAQLLSIYENYQNKADY